MVSAKLNDTRKYRENFFTSSVTIFTGPKANAKDVRDLQGRLERLSFPVVIVECNDGNLSFYHRGDIVKGKRIDYFLDYSESLRQMDN